MIQQQHAEHQVIARKWRPQRFSDVVGQQHVIQTLQNAVRNHRIGHAYLLVGPRGIGKTTIARIFAKAVNCEHPVNGDPCCECSSCKAIAEESSLDVIEVDAASHNSVDHMRSLSEEAYHMPVSSRYKIYIIDEVHMLSKAAWNALLKTVEEPPAHVKFIFATTEAHLVLPTIVSRCQRFDLQPIPEKLILERLRKIANAEGVKIADGALDAIARAAEGGMRDAQSSLEQMLAFFGGASNTEIVEEQVLELFGLTNAQDLDTLIGALLGNQPAQVVSSIHALARRGRNLETLFDDILEMLRGAELTQILPNPETVLEMEPAKIARCRALAVNANAEVLRSFMESLAPVGRILHEALNKSIYLESILLKAMHEAHAVRISDVLARLNQLRTAGELKFLDQAPSLQAQPVKAPIVPITASVAPEVQIPVAQPQEKVVAQEAPQPEVVAQKESEVVAQPEPEVVSEERLREEALCDSHDAQRILEALTMAAHDQNLNCDELRDAVAVSLEHSVLTLKVSRQALPRLEELKVTLLALLQKITGDWAILLNFVAMEGAAAVEEAPAAQEEELEDAEANVCSAVTQVENAPLELDDVQTKFVEVATTSEENIPEATPPLVEEFQACGEEESAECDDASDELVEEEEEEQVPTEEFIDMNQLATEEFVAAVPVAPVLPQVAPRPVAAHASGAPAHAAAAAPEAESDEASAGDAPLRRSVLDQQNIIDETAAMPVVQMTMALFDGEIVDIHK